VELERVQDDVTLNSVCRRYLASNVYEEKFTEVLHESKTGLIRLTCNTSFMSMFYNTRL